MCDISCSHIFYTLQLGIFFRKFFFIGMLWKSSCQPKNDVPRCRERQGQILTLFTPRGLRVTLITIKHERPRRTYLKVRFLYQVHVATKSNKHLYDGNEFKKSIPKVSLESYFLLLCFDFEVQLPIPTYTQSTLSQVPTYLRT